MGAKNSVVAGDYVGSSVMGGSNPGIITGFMKTINVNKDTVAAYQLITKEITNSAASGVIRGIIGGSLLGPVGMLAGTMSAKTKNIIYVAVEFKDGKKSLLEVDGKIYNAIVRACFGCSADTQSSPSTPSLIKCPACGKDVSNQADKCPNCGQPINKISVKPSGRKTSAIPISNTDTTKSKPNGCLIKFLKAELIFGAVIIIMAIGFCLFYTPRGEAEKYIGVSSEAGEAIDNILIQCGLTDIDSIEHDELLDNAHFEGEKGYRISSNGINNIILYLYADDVVYSVRYADNDLFLQGVLYSTLSNYN